MSMDRCMNPYPYQMVNTPYPQPNHQGFDDTPQMKIDPTRFPTPHNVPQYGYPFPYHGCCNHGCIHPGYYNCPPPYPQPYPYSYLGSHPQFHEPYHVPYGPHPPYSMGHPRYGYDKMNVDGSFNDNNGRIFKIEDYKPEFNEKSNESMEPHQMKNYPYPVLLFPPEYLKNNELGNPFKSKVTNWDMTPFERNSQNDKNRFSFPLIMKPYDDKIENLHNESTPSPKSDQTRRNMVFPWNLLNIDDNEKILKPIEKKSSDDIKKIEPHGEMRMIQEGKERKGREIQVQNGGAKKPSKYPPIFLRVESPSKKKNGDGNSRSISPRGDKGKSNEVHASKNVKDFAPGLTEMKKDDSDKKERTVKVIDIPTMKDMDEFMKNEKIKVDESQLCHGEGETGHDRDITQIKDEISKEVTEMEKVKMEDEEAALLIQRFYLGYMVRKWELLKKLKQIDKIQKEVPDLIQRIQELQSHDKDAKERVIIGERIMNLLLKLDTIQGLPLGYRELRKSVAKELTRLQEMIDSITVKEESIDTRCENTNVIINGCEETNELMENQVLSDAGDKLVESDHIESKIEENSVILPEESGQCVLGLSSATSSVSDDESNPMVENPVLCDVDAKLVEPEGHTESSMKDNSVISSKESDQCVLELPLATPFVLGKENDEDDEMNTIEVENPVLSDLDAELVKPDIYNESGLEENNVISSMKYDRNALESTLVASSVLDEKKDNDEANTFVENPVLSDSDAKLVVPEGGIESSMEENNVISPMESDLNISKLPDPITSVIDDKNGNDDNQQFSHGDDDHQINTEISLLDSINTEENENSVQILVEESENHTEKLNSDHADVEDETVAIPGSSIEGDSKLIEENKFLKGLIGKLIEAGEKQFTELNNLSERVKLLEKKLSTKNTAKKFTRSKRYLLA